MITSAKLKELTKVIFSIAVTALFYRYDFTFETTDINAIASALASSSGSILGFLITAIALMTALMDKSLLANLRATGGYGVLIKGSFACAGLNFALLVSSVCLLLPWNNDKYWLLIVTILIASLAATYLLFAGYAFFNVIMATSKK